jgi:hypothetical protein
MFCNVVLSSTHSGGTLGCRVMQSVRSNMPVQMLLAQFEYNGILTYKYRGCECIALNNTHSGGTLGWLGNAKRPKQHASADAASAIRI